MPDHLLISREMAGELNGNYNHTKMARLVRYIGGLASVVPVDIPMISTSGWSAVGDGEWSLQDFRAMTRLSTPKIARVRGKAVPGKPTKTSTRQVENPTLEHQALEKPGGEGRRPRHGEMRLVRCTRNVFYKKNKKTQSKTNSQSGTCDLWDHINNADHRESSQSDSIDRSGTHRCQFNMTYQAGLIILLSWMNWSLGDRRVNIGVEHVFFRQKSEVHTTRSQWVVGLVLDLGPILVTYSLLMAQWPLLSADYQWERITSIKWLWIRGIDTIKLPNME